MALKVGKLFKWIGILIGGLLLLFIVAAIAIPYFYKDELLNEAKKFANTQVNAEVDFDNDQVDVSLLWTFPNFSFSIGDFSITGKDEFEGKKLADIGRFGFQLNLMDVYNGNYTVKSINLTDANLYVKVLKNGKANYDIVATSEESTPEEETTTTSDNSNLKFSLSSYSIENTNVIFDNEVTDIFVEVKNLNHSGTGEFTLTNYDLNTLTEIEALTFAMGGINYLNKTNIEVDFNANIDLDNGKYKLLDNSFRLNALELKADGEINMPGGDDIGIDLTFFAPNTSFGSVLSLIPAAYTKDFEDVQTKGTFSFNGYTKGTYNGKTNKIPAFGINLEVKDAEFKYPDLPLAVEDINTDIRIKNTSSDLDKMLLDVNTFHIKVGQNPFDATLKLRTPLSDPDIDAMIDGVINLDELAEAFPIEGVKELSGTVTANLKTKTKISYIDNSQYDKVDMKGLLGISNVNYVAEDYPPILVNNLMMDFTPNQVDLKDFDLKIGKSDIKASGKLDNILTYFSRDKIMTGALQVKSKLLDLNEIMGEEEEGEATESEALATDMPDTTTAEGEDKVFDKFDFVMAADIEQIKYDVYDIKNLKTEGHFSPAKASLNQFEMLIGEVDLQANGVVENVYGYLFDDELLKGVLNVSSNYMNLNQFMSESGEATEPEAPTEVPDDVATVESDLEPMQLPDNIDFTLQTAFKTLIYDNYKFSNATANVHVHDQILDITSFKADGFGGKLALTGKYNTQNANEPTFAFGYDVDKLDIQTIAKQVGIAKKFIPVIESLYGRFNSKFEIAGTLDKNLYPKMNSITADGLITTFNTVVKGSPSLSSLSDKLKMPDLKTLALDNTTNWFVIEDGRFKIDPAARKIKGMDVIFGGSHGLDNTMDYDMKMRVPRALLNQNPAGQAANNALNTGLGALSGQASKLGIEIEQSEFVNLGIDIGGSPSKPKFNIKLLGAEGKKGETLGDQVANEIKAEADRVKAEAEAKIKAEQERLKAEAEAFVEAEKEKARLEAERLKKEAEEKAKKLAQQAANDPKGAVDSLKNILDNVGKGSLPNLPNPLGGDKKPKNPFGGIKNPFKK
jgi:hypothetical protein